jgi:SAM-dependent methyltransferase
VAGRPFPGADLAARVAGTPDPQFFFDSGRRSVAETQAILSIVGRSFADYERVLDFGCGCGRMLTWVSEVAAAGVELHATDTDADAVAWCREHLPFADTRTNDALPPLDYPDDYFDLVYNHSVFTHIDEARQDAWLPELRRITRPGGHLVLTVHGEHALTAAGGDQSGDRKRLNSAGILFVPAEWWRGIYPAWFGSTYHATWYVFAHWSRWLRIRAYVPRGALDFQDMVLLERRPEGDDSDPYVRGDDGMLAAALNEAEWLLARGPDLGSRSRFGPVGTVWRRVLRTLMRNYAAHERQLDEALLRALRSLSERR